MSNSILGNGNGISDITPFGTKIPSKNNGTKLTPEMMARGAANRDMVANFLQQFGIPMPDFGNWNWSWGGSGGSSPPPPPAPAANWVFPDYTQDWAFMPPAPVSPPNPPPFKNSSSILGTVTRK